MSKKMLNAYIIEDELNSRLLIRDLIEKNCKELKIVGEADNLIDAENDLKELNVDILFCDIKVKGRNTLTFLENLHDFSFDVIFTTAYSDFAIRAFRLNAVDYLLKPITATGLVDSVQRILESGQNLETQTEHQNDFNKLMISESGGLFFIDLKDVLYLKADKTYTEIYTVSGQKLISCKGLSHFESLLSGKLFYRIHHSYIINLRYVSSFNARNLEIELANDIRLNVSNRKKTEFVRSLEQLSYV
ncbi:MAG: response regulator transcription factor [Flavobacteriales bacterium]|nr:response regulator transcription factor [Bacteroidota bacterium]MCB9240297.1 response regulator transcription factor [Flavobacteriales bacterium]